MTGPSSPSPSSRPTARPPGDPAPVPGERPPTRPPAGASQTQLDRAPGDRYAARGRARAGGSGPGTGAPSAAKAVAVALGVALAGGIVLTLLELLDLGAGLLAVGLAIGWLTGLAVRTTPREIDWAATPERRSVVGAALAALGSAVGFGLIWLWSRVAEHGALGPLDYLGERFGPLPAILLLLAAGAAALRAR